MDHVHPPRFAMPRGGSPTYDESKSSVVFKVKHGQTMRRFKVEVDERKPLYLDLDGLRAKIRNLFNISSDAALIMTYLDEDLDEVTLGDNEDLHDIVTQALNPVRINVCVIMDVSSFTGKSSPLFSNKVQGLQCSNLNDASKGLNSVPEPPSNVLSEVSLDVESKASSSSGPAPSVNSPLKLGEASLTTSPSIQNVATNESLQGDASQEVIVTNDSGVRAAFRAEAAERVAKALADLTTTIEPKNPTGCKSPSRDQQKKSKDTIADLAKKSGGHSYSSKHACRLKKYVSFSPPTSHNRNGGNKLWSDAYGSSSSPFVSSEGMYSGNRLIIPPIGESPVQPWQSQTYKPQTSQAASVQLLFAQQGPIISYKGRYCECCKAYPISGPRFKSKVYTDYYMCFLCYHQLTKEFQQMYVRYHLVDGQLIPWPIESQEVANPTAQRPRQVRSTEGQSFSKSMNPLASVVPSLNKPEINEFRINCRFVKDVSVFDGTVMAPKTPFTKVWRLCNNGKDSWPVGTRLLWVGGHKFSDVDAVVLKLPGECLAVNRELEVAVDFTAPELPGRYRSDWRMALPSGQLFGPVIWVDIQVDASLANSIQQNGLDLNIPIILDNSDVKVESLKMPSVNELEPEVDDSNSLIDPLENPIVVFDEPEPEVDDSNVLIDLSEDPVEVPHPFALINISSTSTLLRSADSLVSSHTLTADVNPIEHANSDSCEGLQPELDGEKALLKVSGSTEEENDQKICKVELEGMDVAGADFRKETELEKPAEDLSEFSDSEWFLPELPTKGSLGNKTNEPLPVENMKGSFMRRVRVFFNEMAD